MTHGSTITPFTGQWVMIADFSVCQWVRYSFVFRTEEKSYSWALLSLCGLALIIHPTILLSFWTQKEDERFRLSPLVSEALLCLSFFPLLSCTEPSSLSTLHSPLHLCLSLVILHPTTQNRKRSCDDYFTSMLISSLWVFLAFLI